MKEYTVLCLMVLLAISPVYCQQNNQEITDPGEKSTTELYEPDIYNDIPYRIMKPINYDPDMSYPLIVSLHGAGGKGTDNLKQLRDWNYVLAEEQIRTDYPAFIIAPQATGTWDTTHLQNVKDIINNLPSVDMSRIYVLGHSMGGMGTYLFIRADPNYFAAAAPSAGYGLARSKDLSDTSKTMDIPKWALSDVTSIKDIPIWAFHGDQDTRVPIDGDQRLFAKMQEIGGNMKYTTWVGDGHMVAVKMITGSDNGSTQLSSDRCDQEPVFLKWLFKQKLID